MLELAILGLLKERPMHGYDLRKRLRDELGPFSNLSFGSLYPALGRLERAGAVETFVPDERPGEAAPNAASLVSGSAAEAASQLTRRATARAAAALGGRGTRARKVYDITEQGQLLFEELLDTADGGDDPRSFLLRLGFARHLAPSSRLRLLERRRVQLLDRVERARRLLGQRRAALDRYGLAILEHALEQAQADLAWVDRLLAEEARLPQAADVTESRAAPPGPVAADGVPASEGGTRAGERATAAAERGTRAGEGGTAAAERVTAAGAVGGFAGILHAGRLRRRADGIHGPSPTSRHKEQIGR